MRVTDRHAMKIDPGLGLELATLHLPKCVLVHQPGCRGNFGSSKKMLRSKASRLKFGGHSIAVTEIVMSRAC